MIKSLVVLLLSVAVLSCSGSRFPKSGVDLAFANYEHIYQDKMQYEKEVKKEENSMSQVINKADKALESRLFSVTYKTGWPASKNKHYYFTIAPYFWPNPDTPDHLPYIRKDGHVNPEARTSYTDFNEGEAFFSTVDVLGRAYFLTEDDKYAHKATELISAWFVDTATMMNPYVNYAQGIPGINDGRCFGIIEFGGIGKVVTTIELLKLGGALEPELEKGFNQWIEQYLVWLQTSELGQQEASRQNNHGTHYDKQLCGLLWYLGQQAEVKTYLESVVKARVDHQIMADGKQPHELTRTKAFTYSAMNLRGFMGLVSYGNRVGVDLWGYESSFGGSLKKAHLFLASYLKDKRPWDYQQITHGDYYAAFAKQLISVGNSQDEPELIAIGQDYLDDLK